MGRSHTHRVLRGAEAVSLFVLTPTREKRSMRVFRALRNAAICVSVMTVGCGGNPKPQTVKATPAQPTPAPAAPAAQTAAATPDPIAALIASSERHYDAGERELAQGHLDKARIEFNQALDVLLQSPY